MLKIKVNTLLTLAKLKVVHSCARILDIFLKIHIYGNRKIHKEIYYEGLLLTHHKINVNRKLQESIDNVRSKVGYLPSDWRILVFNFFAKEASKLNGSYVELGVGKGSMSLITIPTLKHSFSSFWLIDKFDPFMVNPKTGLPLEMKMEKIYVSSYTEAKENFKHLEGINVIQGSLPEILDNLSLPSIAFLHIDLNAAQPEVNSLRKLWPLVIDHGIIVLDDYCWAGRSEQFNAMNSLAKDLNFDILSLPTGQGIIFK